MSVHTGLDTRATGRGGSSIEGGNKLNPSLGSVGGEQAENRGNNSWYSPVHSHFATKLPVRRQKSEPGVIG